MGDLPVKMVEHKVDTHMLNPFMVKNSSKNFHLNLLNTFENENKSYWYGSN